MKSHQTSTAVLAALLLILCLQAAAAERASLDSGSCTLAFFEPPQVLNQSIPIHYTASSHSARSLVPARTASTMPDITVNGVSIGQFTTRTSVDGALYVAAAPVLLTLHPGLFLFCEDGSLNATGAHLTFRATEGQSYFQVNGRYLYAPDEVINENGFLLLPAQELCEALGCSFVYDEETQDVTIYQVNYPVTAGTYDEEDLYWLSRGIYAESGNQPMAGRIAVGTVILNRVADPAFPDTIKEVIFAPRQFSPVSNGTIYLTPDHDSIVAAMLCLDGVKEADDCLYFNITSMYSWADVARTYCCTIGDHNFYL